MEILTEQTGTRSGTQKGVRRPRLGFVGVGWIGRHRMDAVARAAAGEVAAVLDPNSEMVREALDVAPGAEVCDGFAALLDAGLDGLVIATPNALHAEQAVRALDAGLAVFCQKPLGRTEAETRSIVAAARGADRLLGVDLSYRHTAGIVEIQRRIRAGEIGDVFAVDVVFHNAYGPGKSWPYDPKLSGGGCVIDLGIHLVDLALWTLGFPEVEHVSSRLRARGRPLDRAGGGVEDYAVARLDLSTGCLVNMACSWDLAAGRDCVIEASFYGTGGGLSMRNVDGSYFDFVTERYDGRTTTRLAGPPDDWGGRAAVAWAERLARDPSYDPAIEHVVDVAAVLDAIYGQSTDPQQLFKR